MTETKYQKTVNSLTGGMGPVKSAYWKNTGTTTGNPWDLGAQPLFYSPSIRKYVTSYESNTNPSLGSIKGAPKGWGLEGTWDPSGLKFGKKRRKSKRRKSKRRKSKRRKSRKRKSKSKRKSRKRKRSFRFGSCGKCGLFQGFGSCNCSSCGKKKRSFGGMKRRVYPTFKSKRVPPTFNSKRVKKSLRKRKRRSRRRRSRRRRSRPRRSKKRNNFGKKRKRRKSR